MATARDLIIEALDEFDVEDFIDPDFNSIAADKIVAKLDWANFKIVKMTRSVHKPLPIED
jgi:hypothetical protein